MAKAALSLNLTVYRMEIEPTFLIAKHTHTTQRNTWIFHFNKQNKYDKQSNTRRTPWR